MLSCLWSIPLHHGPCPHCAFLTQLIVAWRLAFVPSSCVRRLQCSSSPPFVSPSLRLQLCSCLTGPHIISAPTSLIPCLPSQKDGLQNCVPHFSLSSTGFLPTNHSRALLAAGQHPFLNHATQLSSSQLHSKGELLQGTGGSPGSHISDTIPTVGSPHSGVWGWDPGAFLWGRTVQGFFP